MRTFILYTRAILLMAAMLLLPSQLWAEAQPWAEYISSSHELIFHYDEDKAASTATATYDLPTTATSPQWYDQRTDIRKVTFLSSFAQARPKTCYGWFSGMSNLTEIIGLKNLNTSEVTSMYRMFSACTKLTTLDLSTLYTPKVTDMQAMFAGCTSLASLTLSGLTTNEVTTMWEMFAGCVSLTELDLSSFYIDKVKDMEMMFSGCKLLEQIYVSDAFVVSDACTGDNMFQGCAKLPGFTATSVGKEKATSTTSGGYLTVSPSEPWVGYDAESQTLTFHYDHHRSSAAQAYDMPSAGSKPAWSDVAAEVRQVVFSPTIVRYAPTTCSQWFSGMASLTDIVGLAYLRTSGVTSMREMFQGCASLTALDLEGFTTALVYDMSSMFQGCASLTALDLSSFSTAQVIDMSTMFAGCSALTALDLKTFTTDKADNMSGMFQGCSSLEALDLTGFHTEAVTTMSYMFNNCKALSTLDVSGFSTEKVTSMQGMFSGCSSLEALDVSGFSTEKVTSMQGMFTDCKHLTELDLSSFLMNSVTSADSMFYNCIFMETIYVGEDFALNSSCTGDRMFGMCYSLPGFQYGNTGKYYAHYKKGGYFTLRRHLTVGESRYNVDGYDSPTCYTDVPFTDGEAYSAPCAFTFSSAATASYTRSVTNHWATLCLPFAFDVEDQADVRFYSIAGYDNQTLSVTLLDGHVDAGTPILAYTTNGHLSISATGAAAVAAPVSTSDNVLKGVFTQTQVSDDDYIIANDHFWNAGWLTASTGSGANRVYVAPYRAYLTLDLKEEAKPYSINISEGLTDQVTAPSVLPHQDTALSSFLDGEVNDPSASLYDLQGRRLTAPQRGMMIIRKDGVSRKVVVK